MNEKPLISNFDWLEPKEATFLLSAMGLASVPTWLRPFSLLSVMENNIELNFSL
jgi:hypothetical protein